LPANLESKRKRKIRFHREREGAIARSPSHEIQSFCGDCGRVAGRPDDRYRAGPFHWSIQTGDSQVRPRSGDTPPDAEDLYELPGPNWYRPWSPTIVVTGAGRSYRFGEDGRFREDGYLKCRLGGETLYGLSVGSIQATGQHIITNRALLLGNPGLPVETVAIVEEALLLDTESAGCIGAAASPPNALPAVKIIAQEQIRNAVRGIWLSRDPRLTDEEREALEAIQPQGELPSPVALTPWKWNDQEPLDMHEPLFLDVKYAHPFSKITPDWKLEPDQVDLTPRSTTATNPPAGNVVLLEERSYVTTAIVRALKGALLTNEMLNAFRKLVPARKPPSDFDANMFEEMDVLSAPLTAFDAKLFKETRLWQRAGALRLNKPEVIDVFEFPRTWDSGVRDPASTAGNSGLKWWTDLTPRLPFWACLNFRLQSAANPNEEASTVESPVCGLHFMFQISAGPVVAVTYSSKAEKMQRHQAHFWSSWMCTLIGLQITILQAP
jgi:hypothetical protein